MFKKLLACELIEPADRGASNYEYRGRTTDGREKTSTDQNWFFRCE